MINPPPINDSVQDDKSKQFSFAWKQWIGGLYSTVLPIQNYGVYSAQAPNTGFSIQFPVNANILQLKPGGTLAAGSITLPANPVDKQQVTIATTATITSLTLFASKTINNAATTLSAGQSISYYFSASEDAWFSTAAPTAGTGTSGAAGVTTYVQFNYLGALAGSATLTFSPSVGLLSVAQIDVSGGSASFIDGTVLGASVPAAGTFTTLDATDLQFVDDASLTLAMRSANRAPQQTAPQTTDLDYVLSQRVMRMRDVPNLPPANDSQAIIATRIFRR